MNYKKCHNAIIENAKHQGCQKLLKLISLAEELHLRFIFAYHKIFKPLLPNEIQKEMDYIEVVSEGLHNNFSIDVAIIKNNDVIKVTYYNMPNTLNLDTRKLNQLNKEFTNIGKMVEALKKFDMKGLPQI